MVDLAGTLMSPDQARVSAEAAGVVRAVLVEIGREVKVGTPLVKLEPRELQLALARAESALRQTRAQLGMQGPLAEGDNPPPDDQIASVRNAYATYLDAKATADRIHTLAGRGIVSPSDQQAAETRLKVAEAAYQSAADTVRGQKALLQDRRASYDLAVKKLNDATVRAPISGIVSDRPVQVGEFISERTVVATIVQVNPLKLRTGAQEKHAGIIQPGQSVEFRVESYGDTLFHGQGGLREPVARPDDEDLRGRGAGRQHRPAAEAGVLRQGRHPDEEGRGRAGRPRHRGVDAGRRLVGLRDQPEPDHADAGDAGRSSGRAVGDRRRPEGRRDARQQPAERTGDGHECADRNGRRRRPARPGRPAGRPSGRAAGRRRPGGGRQGGGAPGGEGGGRRGPSGERGGKS